MTHETRTGRTHDGVPWVITLHPDGTASAMLPSLEGGTYPQALSGDAGRYLADELPNVEAMIGEAWDAIWEARKRWPEAGR